MSSSAPSQRPKPRTSVYVDGFNLYHGKVQGTPYKWLNLEKLFAFALPEYDVTRIMYFTAIVRARPGKQDSPQNQLTCLRALQTIEHLKVYRGFFLETTHPARLVTAIPCQASPARLGNPQMVVVHKSEEKGSDVNIASHLLIDAFDNQFDVAWVVSNDSDLAYPINVVRQRFNKKVGILNPRATLARGLKAGLDQSLRRTISTGAVKASQFPPTLADAKGTIHRPARW